MWYTGGWANRHPDLGVPQPTKKAEYSWLSHDLFKTEPGTLSLESHHGSLKQDDWRDRVKKKHRIKPSELCSGHACFFPCHTKRCFALGKDQPILPVPESPLSWSPDP